jgi:hypothetical protein
MQRTRAAATGEPGASPSPRMILIADAAWDAIVGAALIAASAASVTRPLGTGPLRPGLVPVALGAVCLAVAALMIHASTGRFLPGVLRCLVCHSLEAAGRGVGHRCPGFGLV